MRRLKFRARVNFKIRLRAGIIKIIIETKIIEKLKSGGVGVIPTDTIYGLAGLAQNQKTVERIYQLRQRDPKKPMVILIGDISDLEKFKIAVDKKTRAILKKYWPGKVSIILTCKGEKFSYLHRGTKSLAFRLPVNIELQDLIKKVGPLVAPSANIEGGRPAETIEEAKKYFEDKVDFYIDGGTLESKPSTLIKIEDGKIKVIREGDIKI